MAISGGSLDYKSWLFAPIEIRTRFVSQNGRPPRFAIDAYMFLFLAGTDVTDDVEVDADIVSIKHNNIRNI